MIEKLLGDLQKSCSKIFRKTHWKVIENQSVLESLLIKLHKSMSGTLSNNYEINVMAYLRCKLEVMFCKTKFLLQTLLRLKTQFGYFQALFCL